MHVSSNRPVSEDEEKLMMYSPGSPFIMVAPVVTSWAVAGQRMVFLHMYLQTQVTLKAFPVATPRGRSSSSHEGEHSTIIYQKLHLFFRKRNETEAALYFSLVVLVFTRPW